MPQRSGWMVAALPVSASSHPVPALASAVCGQFSTATHGSRAGADRVFPRDGDSWTPRSRWMAASSVAPINIDVTARRVPGTLAAGAPNESGLAGAAPASIGNSTSTRSNMAIDGHPALVGTSGMVEDAGGRGLPPGLVREEPRARDGSGPSFAASGSTQVGGSHVNRDGNRVADVLEPSETPSTPTCQAPTPVAGTPVTGIPELARATVADVQGDTLAGVKSVDGVSVGGDRAGSPDSAVKGEVPFAAMPTPARHPVSASDPNGWASVSNGVGFADNGTLPPAPSLLGGVAPGTSTLRGAHATRATPAGPGTHGPALVSGTPASLPEGAISLLSRPADPAFHVGGQHSTTLDREVMQASNRAGVRALQGLDGARSDSIPSETLLAETRRATVADRWLVRLVTDVATGSDSHLANRAHELYARSDDGLTGGDIGNAPGDRKDVRTLATHAAPRDR